MKKVTSVVLHALGASLGLVARYPGFFAAVGLGLLWWYAPSAVLSVFSANHVMLLGVAALLPAAGSKFLSGFVELVQALQTALSAPRILMSGATAVQFQAAVAILANTLLVLIEIKLVRWTYLLFRLITWPMRGVHNDTGMQLGSLSREHLAASNRRDMR